MDNRLRVGVREGEEGEGEGEEERVWDETRMSTRGESLYRGATEGTFSHLEVDGPRQTCQP